MQQGVPMGGWSTQWARGGPSRLLARPIPIASGGARDRRLGAVGAANLPTSGRGSEGDAPAVCRDGDLVGREHKSFLCCSRAETTHTAAYESYDNCVVRSAIVL